MGFLELAKSRYSVRKYENKKVEEEKLLEILEAGRVAPTAANRQPQRFIIIDNEEGYSKLKKGANFYGAPLAIIVCVDHLVSWKRPYDDKDVADIDASIVTDHMMLEATDLGLGTVWISYFDQEIIREEFDIAEHIEPVNILAVGYNAGGVFSADRHDKQRKSLQEIIIK
jgi:nitroreductase